MLKMTQNTSSRRKARNPSDHGPNCTTHLHPWWPDRRLSIRTMPASARDEPQVQGHNQNLKSSFTSRVWEGLGQALTDSLSNPVRPGYRESALSVQKLHFRVKIPSELFFIELQLMNAGMMGHQEKLPFAASHVCTAPNDVHQGSPNPNGERLMGENP